MEIDKRILIDEIRSKLSRMTAYYDFEKKSEHFKDSIIRALKRIFLNWNKCGYTYMISDLVKKNKILSYTISFNNIDVNDSFNLDFVIF